MAKAVDAETVPWRVEYPWDEWLDGRAWVLTKGEDFDVEPQNMKVTALGAATRRGIKIRTRTDKAAGTLTIQRITG